jgi:hypothetical protein
VRTFQAFLDFCYIVRRDVITDHDLLALKNALSCFHKNRDIFISTGVRSNFHLPRQHSMVHYHSLIRQFGAPNGLCSSITESKHIRAIKEPWRRSNRNEALGQMLVTNQRLDQLAAARADFTDRGMLNGTCLFEALCKLTSLRFSNVSEYKETPATATNEASHATINAGASSDADQITQEVSAPDEDISEEIVNDPNVIAEVKLATRARQ